MSQPAPVERAVRRLAVSWDAGAWERLGIAFVLLGVGIRAWWCLVAHPALRYLYSDMGGYVQRGMRLAEGAPLARYDTFFPPGTHILLAEVFAFFGVGHSGLWAASVLWFLLSCLIPVLAWVFVTRQISPEAGAVAAGMCAVYPLFVTYGGYFTSETPALVLLLVVLLTALRVSNAPGRVAPALWFGLAVGAELVLRPQLILNLLIVAAPVAVRLRRFIPAMVASGLGLVVVVIPVLVLNATAAGRVVGISENDGMNFFLAQCDVHLLTMNGPGTFRFGFGNPVAFQQRRGRDYTVANHPPWDRGFYFRQGLGCIHREGFSDLRLLARNVADMTVSTVPWPQSNERRVAGVANVSNIAFFVLMSVAILRVGVSLLTPGKTHGRDKILLLHVASVVPVALLFAGEPRLRVPYDVFGILLVASLADSYLRRPVRTSTDGPRSRNVGATKPQPPIDPGLHSGP